MAHVLHVACEGLSCAPFSPTYPDYCLTATPPNASTASEAGDSRFLLQLPYSMPAPGAVQHSIALGAQRKAALIAPLQLHHFRTGVQEHTVNKSMVNILNSEGKTKY